MLGHMEIHLSITHYHVVTTTLIKLSGVIFVHKLVLMQVFSNLVTFRCCENGKTKIFSLCRLLLLGWHETILPYDILDFKSYWYELLWNLVCSSFNACKRPPSDIRSHTNLKILLLIKVLLISMEFNQWNVIVSRD